MRQVRFLDAEVAVWQTAAAQLAVNGAGAAPLASAAGAHALDGTRLLVVVADGKVVLYDLLSKKPFEVTRAALDGRSPTCVAFLFRGGPGGPGGAPPADGMMASPVLAVGLQRRRRARLIHLATLRPLGRLVPPAGRKSASITAVVALPSQQGARGGGGAGSGSFGPGAAGRWARADGRGQRRPRRLARPGAGGRLHRRAHADRDPFARPLGGPRPRPCARHRRARGRGVGHMPRARARGRQRRAAPRLFTCGADKQLAVWEPQSLSEMWRTKLDAKAPAMSLAYSHRRARAQPARGRHGGAAAARRARCSLAQAHPRAEARATRRVPPPPARRYFNLSGAHAPVMTVNGSAVMAAYTLAQLPVERALRPCVDLAPLIPPGAAEGWVGGRQGAGPHV